jgi:hypothetical protein
LGPATVVLDASDGNLPFLRFIQILATGPTLQQPNTVTTTASSNSHLPSPTLTTLIFQDKNGKQ